MNSAGYARHFEQAAHDGNRFAAQVWSALGRAKDWLVAALRPTSDDEAFLAKSQNLADLERRMLILQSPDHHQSNW